MIQSEPKMNPDETLYDDDPGVVFPDEWQKKDAETGPSSMMKTVEREEARKASQAEAAAAGERTGERSNERSGERATER